MPVYEYKCESCKGRFDRFVRSGEPEEKERACPFCGSDRVRRVFSIFGTGLSGSGGPPGDSCGRKST